MKNHRLSSDEALCAEIRINVNKKAMITTVLALVILVVVGFLVTRPSALNAAEDPAPNPRVRENGTIILDRMLYSESGFDTWMYAFKIHDVEINETDFGFISADGGLSIEPVDAEKTRVAIYIQPKGLKYSINGINAFMPIETAKAILQSNGYKVTEGTEFNSDYIELRYDDHEIHHTVILCKHGTHTDISWYN